MTGDVQAIVDDGYSVTVGPTPAWLATDALSTLAGALNRWQLPTGWLTLDRIPYVDRRIVDGAVQKPQVLCGAMTMPLTLEDGRPREHWVVWHGGYPRDEQEEPLLCIKAPLAVQHQIALAFDRLFVLSRRPKVGYYTGHHIKVRSYLQYIFRPAQVLKPEATLWPNRA